jgi:hypothetical protein
MSTMPEEVVELTAVQKKALARGDMIMMESLRSFTLNTTKGHACQFTARVPRLVPKLIAQEAMTAGCAPVNKEDAPFIDDLSKSKAEFDKPLRRAILFIAMDSLTQENDTARFDGGGYPKQEVVEEITGVSTTKKEITGIYNEYRSCKANNRELPSHPEAAKVYEIVQAESKQDLLDLAIKADYPERQVAGMGSRDLRRLLLARYALAQHG